MIQILCKVYCLFIAAGPKQLVQLLAVVGVGLVLSIAEISFLFVLSVFIENNLSRVEWLESIGLGLKPIEILLICILFVWVAKIVSSLLASKLIYVTERDLCSLLFSLFCRSSSLSTSWNARSKISEKTILADVEYVVRSTIHPIVTLVPALVVAITIILVSMTINPLVFGLVLLSFSFFLAVLFSSVGVRIRKMGELRNQYNAARFEFVKEAFASENVIKGMALHVWALRQFMTVLDKFAVTQVIIKAYDIVPRVSIEYIGLLLLVIAAMFFGLNDSHQNETWLVVSFIALIRVSPTFGKLYNLMISVKASGPVVERLYDEVASASLTGVNVSNPVTNTRGVRPKNRCISIEFKLSGLELEDRVLPVRLNQTVAAESWVWVTGSSGVGKSLLMQNVCGLAQSCVGHIKFQTFEGKEVRPRVGLVPQEPFLFKGSLRENILLGRMCEPEELIRVMELVGLDLLGGPSHNIDSLGSNLSGGQKQRVAIARAIIGCPEILVVDEGTSGVGIESERRILQGLKAFLHPFTTVLFISHRQSNQDFFDCMISLSDRQSCDDATCSGD